MYICVLLALIIMLTHLLKEHLSPVCLSRIRCWKLSKIGAKFQNLCRKSGSPKNNMNIRFCQIPINSQKTPGQCASLLSGSVSDAACAVRL